MEALLGTEEGRFLLLVLAGVGFLLQWDNLFESLREATKKGGDSQSEKD